MTRRGSACQSQMVKKLQLAIQGRMDKRRRTENGQKIIGPGRAEWETAAQKPMEQMKSIVVGHSPGQEVLKKHYLPKRRLMPIVVNKGSLNSGLGSRGRSGVRIW